jgi:hypothetical protein
VAARMLRQAGHIRYHRGPHHDRAPRRAGGGRLRMLPRDAGCRPQPAVPAPAPARGAGGPISPRRRPTRPSFLPAPARARADCASVRWRIDPGGRA